MARIKLALLASAFSVGAYGQQFVVTTVAGGAPPPSPVPAAATSAGQIHGIALDSNQNVYFSAGDCVFKIDSSGTMTRIAGNGRVGFSGDGGMGPESQLDYPRELAVDNAGNLYIADTGNSVARKLTPDGLITSVPGSALFPSLNPDGSFYGVAVDQAGNLYIPDGRTTVWIVTPDGSIAPFAGNDSGIDSGDGGTAVLAGISHAVAVALDSNGNTFIAEPYRVRKVDKQGIITTVAGTGIPGETGDSGQATNARLSDVYSLAVDSSGSLYLGDGTRIRKVTPDGTINTIIGGTSSVSTGDGGPASNAGLTNVTGVAVAPDGELYIGDNKLLRHVSTDGIIETIMGSGPQPTGDGGPGTQAWLVVPSGITLDGNGNIFVADNGSRVRKIDSSGTITTYAGGPTIGDTGDGGQATKAELLLYPLTGLAIDSSGSLFVSEWLDSDVREVASDGTIHTFVGNLIGGFQFFSPYGLAFDGTGNLFIADSNGQSVRKVDPTGAVSVFASDQNADRSPYAIAVDGTNQVYVSYSNALGITRYDPQGNPTELLPSVFSGPMTVDLAGSIYVFTTNGLTKIAPDSSTTLIATGAASYPPDGSAAIAGALINPTAIAVDKAGNTYVADSRAGAVFKLQPSTATPPPTISCVLNSASNLTPPIAPGEIVTLYGINVGPATLMPGQLNSAGLFSSQVGGTQVLFDGRPAPLIYVSATQTAAVVPYEVSGSTVITVNYNGQTSAGLALPVAPSAPGLFTADSSGVGQAAAVNQDGSLNSAAQPASVGDVITLYATGEGRTTPAGVDGALSSSPVPAPLLPVTVTIGGQPAALLYAGEAPGEIAGLLQINAKVPAGTVSGASVPVTLEVGTVTATPVTIAVK